MDGYKRQPVPGQSFKLLRVPKIKRKFLLETGATDTPPLMNQAIIQEVVIIPKGPSGAASLHTVWCRAAVAMPPWQGVAATETNHIESAARRTTRASIRKLIASILHTVSFVRSSKNHSGLFIPQLLQE